GGGSVRRDSQLLVSPSKRRSTHRVRSEAPPAPACSRPVIPHRSPDRASLYHEDPYGLTGTAWRAEPTQGRCGTGARAGARRLARRPARGVRGGSRGDRGSWETGDSDDL